MLMQTHLHTRLFQLSRTAGTSRYLTLTAIHCNTLQHTATHCNTLQHTATQASRYMTPLPWSHCRCTHSTCMRSCVCLHVSLHLRMYMHVCTYIHTQVTSLTSAEKDTKISSYLNVYTFKFVICVRVYVNICIY